MASTCPSVFPLQILARGRGACIWEILGKSWGDTWTLPYLRAVQVEGGSAESEV